MIGIIAKNDCESISLWIIQDIIRYISMYKIIAQHIHKLPAHRLQDRLRRFITLDTPAVLKRASGGVVLDIHRFIDLDQLPEDLLHESARQLAQIEGTTVYSFIPEWGLSQIRVFKHMLMMKENLIHVMVHPDGIIIGQLLGTITPELTGGLLSIAAARLQYPHLTRHKAIGQHLMNSFFTALHHLGIQQISWGTDFAQAIHFYDIYLLNNHIENEVKATNGHCAYIVKLPEVLQLKDPDTANSPS